MGPIINIFSEQSKCLPSLGPYILRNNLNGIRNRRFLRNQLPVLLENVPCHDRLKIWCIHDGAPAHFLLRQHLTRAFNDRLIGRGGPVS